jgi:prepilin-type N-terminal cleavage/methylation domain-containing protein
MMKRGFTLIELLVVMAIMGLLGTASVGGYRAMQRGMEERGAMQNVNQFIRTAYQRAQIDRQPVAVYFWNETIREETATEPPIIVGKAVAVRRAGRITETSGSYLYDEFGDLRFMRLTRDDGDEDEEDASESGSTADGNGMFLYHMENDDTGFQRSIVSQTTKRMSASRERLLATGGDGRIESYAYVIMNRNGVTWERGDAYGFEFAEIQLPHNYIFGSSYSKDTSDPVQEIDVLRFKVSGNSGSGSSGGVTGKSTIQVSSLRPNASGELHAEKVAESESPTKNL